MKRQLTHTFANIINLENLLAAWREFCVGKLKKQDVQQFSLHLADNIIQLHERLSSQTYRHGDYKSFAITDPKPRQIHKAQVTDRVLHHAIYRILYPFFDKTFIADSFSCRLHKGTHKAMDRFRSFARKVSHNHTRTAWVLKCDIKKFFASINHDILLHILEQYISDKDIMWLLTNVIKSSPVDPEKGLPLGNLTSQLLCNIYMNELDQFVKHKLKTKHYVRYADDFVLLSKSKAELETWVIQISRFLNVSLKLQLHPNKIFIKTFASGVDFLGWVHFPTHRVIRTTTKRRIFKRVGEHPTNQTLQSHLGLLGHGNTHTLRQELVNTHGLMEKSY